jgi:hypothetical protein
MKEMICGATGKPCPYATQQDGTKPCKECETAKKFLENFVTISLDAE